MDEKFLCGILLGMLGGALIVTNSVKARNLVLDGQSEVISKVNGLTKKQQKKS